MGQKNTIIINIVSFILICYHSTLFLLEKHEHHSHHVKSSKQSEVLIDFSFKQKNLKDILNDFAQMRDMNIVYPETENITSKVTFDAGKKITMSEAWDFLTMILDQAGFVLIPQGGNMYRLVANKKFFTESIPLYINTDYTALPDSSEKVRYVYFFNNIQISKQQTEITPIIKNILPEQDFAQAYILDLTSNAMILTARAEIIKSVMRLMSVLDESGFKEAVEILKLEYAQASEVTKMLTNMISGADQAKGGGSGGYVSLIGSGQKARYFSEYAKIVNMDVEGSTKKFNSVIIMGKTDDVETIKDFIKKYLDVAQQQGKSFFHVIELQWLQASSFVTVLKSLVQGQTATGQSTSSVGSSRLAFDQQIQIISEQQSAGGGGSGYGSGGSTGESGSSGSAGGNRLIIAAPEKDWKRLDSLIKEVDVPQKQVVIEALVMDLDLEFVRELGSQIRTRGLCPSIFPKDMQAQAAMVSNHVINQTTVGDTTINSLTGDLSQILSPEDGGGGESPFCTGTGGATTFMVGSGNNATNGVWAFFQLLSTHSSAKILTRPLVLASNHKQALLTSSITKQLPGGTTAGTAPTVNYSTADAPVQIKFTPTISENDTISLQVNISLNLWQDAAAEFSGTQTQRELNSTLSMKSGDIVILGGLTKETVQRSKTSVPILDNIPLLGNLLSKKRQTTTKDQLFILIRPTVVAPDKQLETSALTKNAMKYITNEFSNYEDAFTSLKDPVTRWFFNDKDRQSDRIEQKLESLADLDQHIDSGESVDVSMESKDKHSSLQVEWLTDENLMKKKAVPQNKNIDHLSRQLKDAVNPFQRLQL